MARTYHLVPAERWQAADAGRPYEAASLADEGFVHCTDGADEVVATADRHLALDPRPYLVLTVELERVGSPWRYDDPGSPYPHVYGPIERGAILAVTPIERAPDGRFIAFRVEAELAEGRPESLDPVDAAFGRDDPTAMTDEPEHEADLDHDLDPREAARDRRRDRDRSAHERGLMRTGLAKGFKQILDVQARRAERAARAEERQAARSKPKDDKRRP